MYLEKGWDLTIKAASARRACQVEHLGQNTTSVSSSVPRRKIIRYRAAFLLNMMPVAGHMSHVIPTHVLRVGQSVRLEPEEEALNQLMLELDPTFQPIGGRAEHPCVAPRAGYRASSASSRGIPIQSRASGNSLCPSGTLVFSDGGSSSWPAPPGAGSPKGSASTLSLCQGSHRLSYPNRNSASSLLSTSTCSDTSYILGSTLSLASEDVDASFPPVGDGRGPERPDVWEKPGGEVMSSPEQCLSGSFTDIPMLLINGVPHGDHKESPTSEDKVAPQRFHHQHHHGSEAHSSGSPSSMKFVMDSSKFWFRPHISRAEAEAFVKDEEPGTFVVRDSTTYRGSFGLAMKVDPTLAPATSAGGESSSHPVKHFLIESTAKGVRLKGSSQEPYFGSLSALVYQHTISTFALPCKLLLYSQGPNGDQDRMRDTFPSEEKKGTASSNFVYLNAVPTEMLTGPCAVERAVSFTLRLPSGSFEATIVNLKVSSKGITLTDVNRKQFFRRHYPAHLLSYGGNDPDDRRWRKGSTFGARMFGFVAKGVEAGTENVCHVFAEYDSLQPCCAAVQLIQAVVDK
ncbi:tensin-4-like [Stigmatopora argus]